MLLLLLLLLLLCLLVPRHLHEQLRGSQTVGQSVALCLVRNGLTSRYWYSAQAEQCWHQCKQGRVQVPPCKGAMLLPPQGPGSGNIPRLCPHQCHARPEVPMYQLPGAAAHSPRLRSPSRPTLHGNAPHAGYLSNHPAAALASHAAARDTACHSVAWTCGAVAPHQVSTSAHPTWLSTTAPLEKPISSTSSPGLLMQRELPWAVPTPGSCCGCSCCCSFPPSTSCCCSGHRPAARRMPRR